MVVGEFWHNSFRFSDAGEICHFNRWSVLVLVAATVWNLAVWNQTIARWLKPPRTMKALQWLAGVSFAVYFLHPLILNSLMQAGLQNPFLKLVLLIGLSLLAVAGLERLLQKTPRIAQALGW
jgi:peptidoglycan/LPS O-acetylase OafA/YrhL